MGESYLDRKEDVKEKGIVREQRWVGRDEGEEKGVFY